jgi:hypothetical protein
MTVLLPSLMFPQTPPGVPLVKSRMVGTAMLVVVVGAVVVELVVGTAVVELVVGTTAVELVVGTAVVELVVGTTAVELVVGTAVVELVVGPTAVELVVGAAVVELVVGPATVELVVGAAVVVVGAAVVVVGAAVVVVVEPPSQTKAPPAELGWQESQQLAVAPTHAATLPFGGLHLSARLLIEQRTLPRRSTRQQVTKPGFPQVERAAQSITSPLRSCGSLPLAASDFVASPTHFT